MHEKLQNLADAARARWRSRKFARGEIREEAREVLTEIYRLRRLPRTPEVTLQIESRIAKGATFILKSEEKALEQILEVSDSAHHEFRRSGNPDSQEHEIFTGRIALVLKNRMREENRKP